MNRALKPKKPFHVSDPNFCDGCGAMLPQIPEVGDIQCLNCKKMIPVDDFEAVETTYTIWFNKVSRLNYINSMIMIQFFGINNL